MVYVPRGPTTEGALVRVCMLVKNSFEYDARVRREADALADVGYEVTVVALQTPRRPASETVGEGIRVLRVARIYGRLAAAFGPSTTVAGSSDDRQADGLGARLRRSRWLTWPARWLNSLVVDARMVRSVRRIAPDIVHAHDLNTLAAALLAARSIGAKVVYDAHELHGERHGQEGSLGWVIRGVQGVLVRKADAVITTTGTWADWFRDRYDIPRPAVLRNVPVYTDPTGDLDIRRRLGLDPGTRVLVYQGSVQRGRGLDVAVEALGQLPANHHLVVIGYGSYLPVLEQRARRRGVEGRVHLFGAVPHDELIHWTSTADIGLCCIERTSFSYYTSLPNKLFEYVMARVPVIASDFPEMGRFVREMGVGATVDPQDPAAVSSAVHELGDRDRYAARRAATDRVARELHWGNERSVLLDLYGAI